MSEGSQRVVLSAMIRRLMVGQSLSKAGDTFTQVAMAIFVLQISHQNPAALGMVLAMMYAPRMILGWAAMGWIDRWNKRRLLLIADGARAALVLSIAIVHTFAWTLGAVFLVYMFQMVYQPTVRSIQPMLAGSNQANRVSVARQDQWSQAGNILAYVFSGVLFLRFGPGIGFVFDSISYLVSGALIWTLPATLPLWQGVAEKTSPYFEQIKEGFRYVRSHRLAVVLVGVSFLAMVGAAGSGTLFAPAMRKLWHQPTADYAWALLALAVGAMVGARLLETKGLNVALRSLLIGGFILTGLSTMVLTLVGPQLWTIMLVLALGGAGNAMFSTSLMVWLQQSLPVEVRGRVMTMRSMTMGLGGIIGSYGVGELIVHDMVLGFFIVGAIFVASGAVMLVPWFFKEKDQTDVPAASSA